MLPRIFDLRRLSKRNKGVPIRVVGVANGVGFVCLSMPRSEARRAISVVYLHVHRRTRRCYVGITVMAAGQRWARGTAYRSHRRFGRAIAKYGWSAFDSHVVSFFEDRRAAERAERRAIRAAGGHASPYTFNLSPGGDQVADNGVPLVGVNLSTGATRRFESGLEASRILGLLPDAATAVARKGKKSSAGGWWFRIESDRNSRPPSLWGRALTDQRCAEAQGKPVLAVNLTTGEFKEYLSAGAAGRALGITQTHVSMIARGKVKSAKGWWFKFKGEDRNPPKHWGKASARLKLDVPVYGTFLGTGETRVFRNCLAAGRDLGLVGSSVWAVAKGKRASAGGWWFSYSESAKPPKLFAGSLVAAVRSKPIVAIDLATGSRRTFPSGKAASIELGIPRSRISTALSGRRNPPPGWRFEFVGTH